MSLPFDYAPFGRYAQGDTSGTTLTHSNVLRHIDARRTLRFDAGTKALEDNLDRCFRTTGVRSIMKVYRDRGRLKLRFAQCEHERKHLIDLRAEGKSPRAFRKWMHAERRFRDDRERAERPDHEFRDVESRHVLHDLAAGVRDHAVGAHQLDPDDQILERPVAQRYGAVRVRRKHSADRRAVAAEWIDRQTLPALAELRLQLAQGHACLDDDDLIFGRIIDNSVQPARAKRNIFARRRIAETELRPRADRCDGLIARWCGPFRPTLATEAGSSVRVIRARRDLPFPFGARRTARAGPRTSAGLEKPSRD